MEVIYLILEVNIKYVLIFIMWKIYVVVYNVIFVVCMNYCLGFFV